MNDIYDGDGAHTSFGQNVNCTDMHRDLLDSLKPESLPALTKEVYHNLDSYMKLALSTRCQASALLYAFVREGLQTRITKAGTMYGRGITKQQNRKPAEV